jgi:hypothetical protein
METPRSCHTPVVDGSQDLCTVDVPWPCRTVDVPWPYMYVTQKMVLRYSHCDRVKLLTSRSIPPPLLSPFPFSFSFWIIPIIQFHHNRKKVTLWTGWHRDKGLCHLPTRRRRLDSSSHYWLCERYYIRLFLRWWKFLKDSEVRMSQWLMTVMDVPLIVPTEVLHRWSSVWRYLQELSENKDATLSSDIHG